jgi:hypothetical protein
VTRPLPTCVPPFADLALAQEYGRPRANVAPAPQPRQVVAPLSTPPCLPPFAGWAPRGFAAAPLLLALACISVVLLVVLRPLSASSNGRTPAFRSGDAGSTPAALTTPIAAGAFVCRCEPLDDLGTLPKAGRAGR